MARDVAERRAVTILDGRQGFSQLASDFAESLFVASAVVRSCPALTQIPDPEVVGEFVVAAPMFRDSPLRLPLLDLQLHGLQYRAERSVNIDPDNRCHRASVQRWVLEGYEFRQRFVAGWRPVFVSRGRFDEEIPGRNAGLGR